MPSKKTANSSKVSKVTKNAKKNWNIAVYMAGDNDLVDESIWAITEMSTINGNLKNIALKVHLDHGQEESDLDFSPKGSASVLKEKHKNSKKSAFPDLKTVAAKFIKAEDTTAESLLHFMERVIANSTNEFLPAKAYQALILSGHTNADPLHLLRTDNPIRQLSLLHLGELLGAYKERHGKLDLLGFDSCTMSSVETIFELHECADYLVAAQGNEMLTGWPYARVIGALNGKTTTPETAASLIVREYIQYYAPYVVAGVSTDLSACDMREQPGLQTALLNLSTELLLNYENPQVEYAIIVAHWYAQSYKNELTVDLYDFCEQLVKTCQVEAIQNACREVLTAVCGCVDFNSYTGAATQHSHGLSIYFPWALRDWENDKESYRQLKFARYTQWDEFLDKFLVQTQRGPRKRDDKRPNGKFGDPKRWIMPLDGGGATAFKQKEGTKGNILEKIKGNILEKVKGNILEKVKGNILEKVKGNILEKVKGNILEKVKLKGGRLSNVKNPAEEFYRYDDECKL